MGEGGWTGPPLFIAQPAPVWVLLLPVIALMVVGLIVAAAAAHVLAVLLFAALLVPLPLLVLLSWAQGRPKAVVVSAEGLCFARWLARPVGWPWDAIRAGGSHPPGERDPGVLRSQLWLIAVGDERLTRDDQRLRRAIRQALGRRDRRKPSALAEPPVAPVIWRNRLWARLWRWFIVWTAAWAGVCVALLVLIGSGRLGPEALIGWALVGWATAAVVLFLRDRVTIAVTATTDGLQIVRGGDTLTCPWPAVRKAAARRWPSSDRKGEPPALWDVLNTVFVSITAVSRGDQGPFSHRFWHVATDAGDFQLADTDDEARRIAGWLEAAAR